jgi:hypothetical protein
MIFKKIAARWMWRDMPRNYALRGYENGDKSRKCHSFGKRSRFTVCSAVVGWMACPDFNARTEQTLD